MKRNLQIAIAVTAVLSAAASLKLAAHPAHEKNAFTPDAIQWAAVPPVFEPGAQLAVLEGDPMGNSGDYTVRLKMPNGYRIAPHWHPLRENVTVISGTFKVGMGDSFDKSKMSGFPAGSFAYLDPNMHHYAMADGEVIVQVHGAAPFQINYVNASDDPSKRK